MKDLGRRDFLKVFAAGIGGVILTSCHIGGDSDGSGGDGNADIPNGYSFYRVKSVGDTVNTGMEGFMLDRFYGSALIASTGIITFNARNSNNRGGIFQLGVEFAGKKPAIEWERAAVLAGDELWDGRIVRRSDAFDANDSGNIAAVIKAANPLGSLHYGDGLYIDYEQSGFAPLVITRDRIGQNPFICSGVMGDVDIHGNNDILIAGDYTHEDTGIGEGLFYLPGASVQESATVLRTGDILPASDDLITGFGLIDMHDHGRFVAHASAEPVLMEAAPGTEYAAVASDFLCSGSVHATSETGLTAPPPEVESAGSLHTPFYGPRIGPDGKKLIVYSDDIGNQKLVYGNRVRLRTEEILSSDGRILGFGPGAIAPDGLFYYTIIAEKTGLCLMASDGNEHRMILAAGDVLSDGGAPVESIDFGASTKHVDAKGRIVLICHFTDQTSSLVVGIPS